MLRDAHPGLSPPLFGLLAIALGVVAGFGAWAFRMLIAIVHNLAFLGRLSADYNTDLHTPPSPWGWGVVLVPAVGAVIVVFLVEHFAPEARGHGVPEVMDAIYYHRSIIRPIVAAIKALASAVSIGTGGSVGREGPIIQIGAAFASLSGRLARVSRWQAATLVAAGGGAGIAATFNTPIGGVLFAVEVLLHEVSARTLVPVALATTTSTYVGRLMFGNTPAFPVPQMHLAEDIPLLPAYLGLGVVAAFMSIAFIRGLYGTEDLFERLIPRHPYLRHLVGMLIVGGVFATLLVVSGHYYVQGVGYATIIDVLLGSITSPQFLLILCLLKLLVTSVTLGSGASGGIFSPSLFMGATLGQAYGALLHFAFPHAPIRPEVFALAGMAGVVGGATGAAMTAIVMIFEMTLNYAVVLPMTLTVAMSYGLRRLILPESIYTMKLVRRGHVMPEALVANAEFMRHVSDMSLSKVSVLAASTPPLALDLDESAGRPEFFVLVDRDQPVGFIVREWALGHRPALQAARNLSEVARRDFVVIASNTTLFDLLAMMQRARASIAIVATRPSGGPKEVDPTAGIAGVVTQGDITQAIAEGLELFED